MFMSVSLPNPCQTCIYHRIIDEYGNVGCSAFRPETGCPKVHIYSKTLWKLQDMERRGVFRGYKRKVFGEGREP
jgi:hypothetical protein